MSLTSLNISSKTYGAGTTILPRESNRRYLMIVAEAALTVAFGELANGPIPIAATGYIEPYVTPTSKVTIVATGAFTITSNQQV